MIKILNLFERFPDYSKEEILEAVARIKIEDQDLLKKAFGEELNDTSNYRILTSVEKSKVRKIISRKVHSFLENPNNKEIIHCNDILNYYKTYTKEEILEAIKRLSKEQRELIIQVYGEELNKTDIYKKLREEEKAKIRYILPKVLLKRLENKEISEPKKGKTARTLIERFPNKNKIELEYAINQLTINRIEILKKAFGESYDSLDQYGSLDKTERRSVQVAIIQLKEKFKSIEEKGIFGYFNNYSKEKIENAIKELPLEEQNMIYSIFGQNLTIYNNLQALPEEELEILREVFQHIHNNIIIEKKQPKKETQNKSSRKRKVPQSIREFFPNITLQELESIILLLEKSDQLLLKKAYGNSYDSIEELENLSSKEVNRIGYIRKKIRNVISGKIKKEDINKKRRKGLNAKSFIQFFDNTPQETIIEIISSLPEEDQLLLRKAYGDNFDQIDAFYTLEVLEKRRIEKIKRKVRNIIFRKNPNNSYKKRGVKAKSLIDFFHNYSMDDIEKALLFLTNEEIQLLKNAYGENLNSTDGLSSIDIQERKRIYNLKNKIKKILEKGGLPVKTKHRKRKTIEKKVNKPIQKKKRKVPTRKKESPRKKQKKYIPMSRQKELKCIKSLKLSYYYDVDSEKRKEYLNYYFEVFPLKRKKYESILLQIKELKEKIEEEYNYYSHEENGLIFHSKQPINILKELSHQLKSLEEKRIQLLEQYIFDSKERRDKFLENNQGLVISVARSKKFNAPLDDLISEGNIGMMKSLERFDVNTGNKFSTYATWGILGSIYRYMKKGEKTIRIPVEVESDIIKVNKVIDQLTIELSRNPTIDEISQATDYTEKQVIDFLYYLEQLSSPMSLDQKIAEESDRDFNSIIGKEDSSFEEIESKLFVEQFLQLLNTYSLSEEEQNIIVRHYGLDGSNPCTIEQLARELETNKHTIRRIVLKTLQKIRSNTGSINFLQGSLEEEKKLIRKRM